jgi:trans-2,3-dihydro-3-hydroxyanthranilate isomerase
VRSSCYTHLMRTIRYVVCDVFTERPLAGNQLAVFTNAAGLDAPMMQSLACEMNFSESTFVLPPSDGGHARIRIFTPHREVPFAGHPTLGSAFVLGEPMQLERIRLETGKGTIEVRLEREGARVVFGRMQQPLPNIEPYANNNELFAALGVSQSRLPLECYDNGIRHVFVVLESRDQVRNLRPDLGRLKAIDGALAVSVCAGTGSEWKTRMFAPSLGVAEDPATGSAAGPLALHLARHEQIAFGQMIRIEQGDEIGRPSVLHACANGSKDNVERLEVGGSAVVVARGEFRVRATT